MQLSADQQTAFRSIENMLDGEHKYMSLIGPAGSGKTTLMKAVVKSAKNWDVVLSAPTHKAAANLATLTGEHARTIHSNLSIKIRHDYSTGEIRLVRDDTSSSKLKNNVLLIIDEASMLPHELTQIILDESKKINCKILFVGDVAQLNPVNEAPSITVDKDRSLWPIAELTQIHRHAAGNPIITAATAIRTSNDKLDNISTDANDGIGIHRIDNRADWLDLMKATCASDNDSRYIGYTNKSVDNAAKQIRRERYGADAEQPYIVGERLIVNDRYCAENKDIENSTEIVIENVRQKGKFYYVESDGITFKAFANYAIRKKHLDELAKVARANRRWREFFRESETIADLRSSSSSTIHKSQGSTYENVFIDANQIATCLNLKEKIRLAYVAVTRPSKSVFITGSWN